MYLPVMDQKCRIDRLRRATARRTTKLWRRVDSRFPTVWTTTNGGGQASELDDLEPRWTRRRVEGELTRVVSSKYRWLLPPTIGITPATECSKYSWLFMKMNSATSSRNYYRIKSIAILSMYRSSPCRYTECNCTQDSIVKKWQSTRRWTGRTHSRSNLAVFSQHVRRRTYHVGSQSVNHRLDSKQDRNERKIVI